MADRIVHGFAVGVRDVPGQGLLVRVVPAVPARWYLTPEQAGELAAAIEQAAIDATRETDTRHLPPVRP